MTIAIKGLLKAPDGSHLGMLADVYQKIPAVSDFALKADIEWHNANDPLP